MRRYISFLIVVVICLAPASSFSAANPLVTILLSDDLEPFRLVSDGVKDLLIEDGPAIELTEHVVGQEGVITRLKESNPAVILTIGTRAAKLAATELPDIPLVFAGVVKGGEIKKIIDTRPGVVFDIPFADQIVHLKRLVARLKTVGIIYSPRQNEALVAEAESILKEKSVSLKKFPVNSLKDIRDIKKMNIDALIFIPDNVVCQPVAVKNILISSLKAKIPVMGISPSYAKAGAAFALSADYYGVGTQAGKIIIRFLGGQNPSDMVFEYPKKINYYINGIIIKKLRLKLSQEFIDGAKEVFGK